MALLRNLRRKTPQHQQLKKLRVDDVEESEDGDIINHSKDVEELQDGETVNHSDETEKYSWDQNSDWLEPGHFDSVVKGNGGSPVDVNTERQNTGSPAKLNGSPEQSTQDIELQRSSSSEVVSETKSTTLVSGDMSTTAESENENEHTSPGGGQIPKNVESPSKNTTPHVTEMVVAVDNSCSPQEIECECPHEGTSACGCASLPHTHKDKMLPGKPNLKKITSLFKDAQTIGELLNIADVDLLYEKVKQRRALPNRVEVVTNEVLEKGMDAIATEIKAQYQGQPLCSMEDELMAEMEQVIDFMKKRHPSCKVDANDVYALLESNYKKTHRMQAVINILTGSIGTRELPMQIDDEDEKPVIPVEAKIACSGPTSLVEDVQAVLNQFPAVDPNFAYELLERFASRPDRISVVCNELTGLMAGDDSATAGGDGVVVKEADSAMPTDAGTVQESAEANSIQPVDPLVKDTEFVSRMFPNKDKDEIYAYLEAHYNKPNRVDIVTEELLHISEHTQPSDESQNNTEARENGESKSSRSTATDHVSAVVGEDVGPLAQLEKDVETMRTVFPDCDPMYLYETLSARADDPQRVEKLSSELFEHKNYPKLKDRLEKARKANLRNRLINLTMDIEEFLQMFPDPVTHFHQEEKAVTETYKQHARIHLQNCYPMLHARYVQEKLDDHNGHLTPTMKDLAKDVQIYNRGKRFESCEKFIMHGRIVKKCS